MASKNCLRSITPSPRRFTTSSFKTISRLNRQVCARVGPDGEKARCYSTQVKGMTFNKRTLIGSARTSVWCRRRAQSALGVLEMNVHHFRRCSLPLQRLLQLPAEPRNLCFLAGTGGTARAHILWRSAALPPSCAVAPWLGGRPLWSAASLPPPMLRTRHPTCQLSTIERVCISSD
jgi:hypothetical protein